MSNHAHVVMLVGGIGGAKLALGMAHVLPTEDLTLIVNTGDDFEHLGLHISPDVDTVMYTVAGIANPETGWGIAGDTSRAMEMVERYGGPDWFQLGDSDLGTNLMRTIWLREGLTLSAVTRRLCAALDVPQIVLPMTDDAVRTVLETDQGTLSFQQYFVRERWRPVVKAIRYEGANLARLPNAVSQALERASLIVLAPSNPYLSIDPILSIPGIRKRIELSEISCVAVSPIIGGRAVKGPTAKLMHELGIEPTSLSVVHHYQDLLDGIILDDADRGLCDPVESLGIRATTRQTLMKNISDKERLAHELLQWIEEDLK